jgi:hypothetical protein
VCGAGADASVGAHGVGVCGPRRLGSVRAHDHDVGREMRGVVSWLDWGDGTWVR